MLNLFIISACCIFLWTISQTFNLPSTVQTNLFRLASEGNEETLMNSIFAKISILVFTPLERTSTKKLPEGSIPNNMT